MTAKEMNKRTDKTTIDKIQRCLFGIAIMVVSLFNVPGMRAEGSKELNPEGVKGNRAFLISMTGQYAFNPFATTGRMMVYAEVGETIYVGSSSQGFGAGTINLYSPSGVSRSSGNSTTVGRIQNRTQELAGPAPLNGAGYTPFTVTVNETGIWVVEFWARGTNMSGASTNQNTTSLAMRATVNWTTVTPVPAGQVADVNTNTSSAFVTAWDVTVAKGGVAVPGRVFTTVFNLGMNSGYQSGQTYPDNDDGFFGKIYGLTRDGYSYLVDNNGQNGLSFNTFINNKGALDPTTKEPIYETFGYSGTAVINQFHDPRMPDTDLHVTHKMFYNKPAADLPPTAYIWQPTGGTMWPNTYNASSGGESKEVWLRRPRGNMIPKDLDLIGVEGIKGYYTRKGAYFVFDSDAEGEYEISIPAADPADTRVLTGYLVLGRNEVYWNGLDNKGAFMLDNALSNVSIKVTAAEVHFPFIDVENNVHGISIQALDENNNPYSPAKDEVWWRIPTSMNLDGTNPPTVRYPGDAGHHSLFETGNLKWGADNSGNNFGNNKAVVVWINQSQFEGGKDYPVNNITTDLEVVSVTRESSSFKVRVKNKGPHDATIVTDADGTIRDNRATFMFFLPMGLTVDPAKVDFSNEPGSTIALDPVMTFEDVALITDPQKKVSSLKVKLNMPYQHEGTFNIPFSFDGSLVVDIVNAWGTIMRANDVTDPNALNTDVAALPVCPFEQANGIWKSIGNMTNGLNAEIESNSEFANLRGSINGTISTINENYTNNIKYDSFPVHNYWYGTNSSEWAVKENWTANYVPHPGQDIVFATTANNTLNVEHPDRVGTAVRSLHLDAADQNDTGGRVIGNLVNNSTVDLWITTGNQLIINGTVTDTNAGSGTVVVKADKDNAATNGTLLFANPGANKNNVQATVEFYNKAYECDNCGFYRKQWQYFGIPVTQSATFPATGVTGTPTINQWVEQYNGDKWRPAPYDPMLFTPFKGYEITNSVEPDGVYSFTGILNVDNATVALTSTTGVNYRGVNLVGNSFTAAIPINEEALQFSPGITDKSVYLFNTGTRDQWRKFNGSSINGLAAGRYLAVPIKLAGEEEMPKMIPSMHAFMILADDNASTLTIDYGKLVKNQLVKDVGNNDIAMRSTSSTASSTAPSSTAPAPTEKNTTVQRLPSIKMDVIGGQSADRVWIFAKEGTTRGFDSGWDGRKMAEEGIAQLYVADDTGKERFQVATVPGVDNLPLGFDADTDGSYTLEFALSDHWTIEEVWLNDLVTGTRTRITNGGSYSFQAKKGDPSTRFSLSAAGGIPANGEAAKIIVAATEEGTIAISNNSSINCTVFVSNTEGKLLRRLEVAAGSQQLLKDIPTGTYVARLQNAEVNDARRVTVF